MLLNDPGYGKLDVRINRRPYIGQTNKGEGGYGDFLHVRAHAAKFELANINVARAKLSRNQLIVRGVLNQISHPNWLT